jgi:anthranilate synthase/aminodeoxychorismate synthase-like glutamine amidotransferase
LKLLLIDNYDSFTYNLYHYLAEICTSITVARNDEISVEETDEYSHIVLSPGPGLPRESHHLMEIVNRQVTQKPMLGICLGMQAIALHFGGVLYNQQVVKHGVTTLITADTKSALFKNLPDQFTVGLYHSWAVREANLPAILRISAKSQDGVLMALEHKKLPVAGVQFHPESILTPQGKNILRNWLQSSGQTDAE